MLPDPKYFHIGDNGIYYGLYGGLDYSAGVEDGKVTGTSADPPPVDAFDQLFYNHDYTLQQATTREERLEAHVDVVRGVYELVTGTSPHWDIF
ncbi:hypothetical protein BB934_32730 (plasmid) [Microvirga ossetica]|uniref:Uncharacterized protein n=1 Tax=Microvirga ossetica TaxID=1882682 RepID=A0A1B2ESM7_9HYPH|nr:hypothetical protein [Microvirga ossetica]ANY82984.1 hypothetical protein BB934_32730 [Microvirga ossetica]